MIHLIQSKQDNTIRVSFKIISSKDGQGVVHRHFFFWNFVLCCSSWTSFINLLICSIPQSSGNPSILFLIFLALYEPLFAFSFYRNFYSCGYFPYSKYIDRYKSFKWFFQEYLQRSTRVLLCTTVLLQSYSVLLRPTKYFSSTVLYYSVLQSITKYYSTVLLRTRKCYKVLIRTQKSYLKCHWRCEEQHHQILCLPRKVTVMIDACQIWNVRWRTAIAPLCVWGYHNIILHAC